LHPLVWDPFLLSVFLLPTFLVFGLLGMLLLWLAQRRQETLDRVSRA
jgi:hypothetical protein